MKNKKLLAIAALLLVFACAVLVACDNDVAKVEIALDKSAVTVEVGGETTISAIVTGSNQEIMWTTDDESVATVNGGKIVGVKVGATVVKATVGDVTVDCNVTVTRPSVVGTLKIDYSSLSLLVGKTAEVNATVEYKGTDVDGLIYDWSVDGGEVCSVSADGKTATVKGLTAGEATINVSTVHLGETLTESMSVVVKNDVSLTVDNLTLSDNKYILNLVTATPDGYNGGKSTNFAPMFKVEVDGKIVADAVVNVTVANADKAVVEYDSEQGEFVAKGVGSATISCVYTLDGAEYKVEILASVELPEVQLEKAFMLETGREICLVEGIDGVATSVKIDGITVEFENTQQGIVLNNLADFAFGVHAIEVCTATEKLTAQVEIVTLAIANKADFDSIATVANKGDGVWDGYFVLVADINYDGTFATFCGLNHCAGWGGTTGFVGTFDGRGHVVKGITIAADADGRGWFGGVFGVLGATGVVKNVGFVNATLSAGDASAIVSDLCYGTISNVFVEVNNQGGQRCAAVARALYGTIENTIVYLTGSKPANDGDFAGSNLALASFVYDGAKLNNCFSVGALELYRTGGDSPVAGAESDKLKKFATLDEMKKHTFDDSWATVWSNVDGMPVFASYIDCVTVNVDNAIANDNAAKVDGKLLIDGEFGYRYSLKTPVDGISIEGNVVTVTDAFDVEFTIVATCVFDPTVTTEKTFTTVGVPSVNLQPVFDVDKSKETTVIVLDELDGKTVVEVKIGEFALTFTQEGKQLTIGGYADIAYGEGVVKIMTDKALYNANVLSAWFVDSVDEWNAEVTASQANPTDWNKYYVLAADLDYTGTKYVAPKGEQYGAVYGFKGTFDGRNHKIIGLTIRDTANSFFGTVAMTATIKNVAFTNCAFSYFDIDGTTFLSVNKSGIVADLLYGTLENVFVQGNLAGHWWCGGIAYFVGETATVKNCIVQADVISGDKCSTFFASADSKANLVGCYAVTTTESSTMMLVGVDPSVGVAFEERDDVKTVASYDALKDCNFDDWDRSVWSLVNGYPQFVFA